MMPRAFPFLALLAIGTPAFAQQAAGGGFPVTRGHDSNAPIDVSSDRIEVQDQANRAVFVGAVHVVQGDMTMDAARMTVAYARARKPGAKPQIERIDASGGVSVVQPDQRARGNYGIYDLNRKLITLVGNVSLIRSGNTVNGARAVMNLDTGRATVDGSAVGGGGGTSSSGGRVTGRFTVPQRADQSAQPPARK